MCCVNNFGVKYFDKADVEHLMATLKIYYKILTDWEGKNYCRLTLNWNYDKSYVNISMSGYVKKALEKYQHKKNENLSMRPIKGTSLHTDKSAVRYARRYF